MAAHLWVVIGLMTVGILYITWWFAREFWNGLGQ